MAILGVSNGLISVGVATDHPSLDRWLTDAERTTRAAIRDANRLSDWRAGRIAAKRAAAAMAEIDELERIQLFPVHGSAQRLSFREGAADSHGPCREVSLAHRDGHAAAAVGRNGGVRVGVDLERERAVCAAYEPYFLAPEERGLSAAWDRTTLWALKEAARRALGGGVSMPLTAPVLRFDRENTLCALSLSSVHLPAAAAITHPWPGYVLAIVWVPGGEA